MYTKAGMERQRMNEGREGQCVKWDNSRVGEGPAEIAFCEGKQRAVAGSQGYPVDVGPRLGTITGMEMIRHAVGTVDPGRVTKEQLV